MKRLLFYFSISFMLIILSLAIINLTTRTSKINFERYESYEKSIKELENKVSTYKDTDCILDIKQLIKKSKDTYFVGDLTLKEIHDKVIQNDEIWLSIYGKTKESCNIDNKEIDDYALTTVMFYEELLQKNSFNYEFILPDFENHMLGDTSLTTMENRLRKDMEIKTIEGLLNEVLEWEEYIRYYILYHLY